MKNLKRQVGKELERITGIKRGSGGGIGLKDKNPNFYAGSPEADNRLDMATAAAEKTSRDFKRDAMKDNPLFGEDDQIINALEMERNILRADLEDLSTRKLRIETKKAEVETRRDLIQKALETMRKRQDDKPWPQPAKAVARGIKK